MKHLSTVLKKISPSTWKHKRLSSTVNGMFKKIFSPFFWNNHFVLNEVWPHLQNWTMLATWFGCWSWCKLCPMNTHAISNVHLLSLSLRNRLNVCEYKLLQICCGSATEHWVSCVTCGKRGWNSAIWVVCGAGSLAGSTTDAPPSASSTGSSQPSLTQSPGTYCPEVALSFTHTFQYYTLWLFKSSDQMRVSDISFWIISIYYSFGLIVWAIIFIRYAAQQSTWWKLSSSGSKKYSWPSSWPFA